MADAAPPPPIQPSKFRSIPLKAWWILVLMTLDSVLGIIDRQTVAVLKTTLKSVFSLTDTGYSWLVSAFLIPYALFYVICGRIVDRYGSQVTMTAFVLIWSLATAAGGLARTFEELMITRAILGAAEAGLVPASLYALIKWFPRDRIATANALKAPLNALGPILAPPLIVMVALAFSWREAFLIPGLIGVVFAFLWWFSDRNPPAGNLVGAGRTPMAPLKEILTNPLLWGIIAARMISDPLWFFIQYWQAGYLQEVLGLSLAQVGSLLWIPPMVTAFLQIGVALISDRLIRRGWQPAASRIRLMQAVTILAPLVIVIPLTRHVPTVILLLTTTYFMGAVWLALTNVLMADIFQGRGVGTAAGIVNALGTAGAALFNLAVGPMLDSVGYGTVFLIAAFLHPTAALVLEFTCLRRLRAEKRALREAGA